MPYWDAQIGTWLPDDPTYQCSRCDKQTEDEDEFTLVDDEWICDECIDEYEECDECKNLKHQDELEEVNGRALCKSCTEDLQTSHTVEFIEAQHIYLVDGLTIVPSVTQIMKPLSEAYYTGINGLTLDEAAKRGTRVHKAIEDLENGVVTLNMMEQDILPYVKNYLLAKHIKGFTPIKQEFKLTDGEYAGTIDMLALMDGKQVIIDFKATSKFNQMLGEVQLAGYHELCIKNGIKVEGHYILHLTKDRYKLHEIKPNFAMWMELKNEKLRALRKD